MHQLVIASGNEVIARHERSYERETVVFDPMHYLALVKQKTRALGQAALFHPTDEDLSSGTPVLAGWQLPECVAQLRRLLEARLRRHGSREYVHVLRLMGTFAINKVTHAIEDALKLGTSPRILFVLQNASGQSEVPKPKSSAHILVQESEHVRLPYLHTEK